MSENPLQYRAEDLVAAFRCHYERYKAEVSRVLAEPTDEFPLRRLCEELEEFMRIAREFGDVLDADENRALLLSVAEMQADLEVRYEDVVSASHHGRPEVVYLAYSGGPGQPQIMVNPEFLAWAYHQRTTSALARFLGIGRTRLRELLLEHGIAAPGVSPFAEPAEGEDGRAVAPSDNDFLDPATLPIPDNVYQEIRDRQLPGYLSELADAELDGLLLAIRSRLRRAGISILDGMLRHMGYRIPRDRIRQSLLRIDPVHRIFERITIRRRGYSVPGPNALWHHDGQHGLIRWGIVIHGFIDGYSRLITALRASGNNYAATVLEVFLCAALAFGIPARCRGDHGTENLFVAEWMERSNGTLRGSYIWGRSVHNVRIERLWVDVTVQVGSVWSQKFYELELQHGLNVNNRMHIWLLHHLFLPAINRDLIAFAQAWNSHRLNIRNGPNRSPEDMFVFDSVVYGRRGYQLELTGEELQLYGLDWDALTEERVLASHAANNPANEDSTSWTGRVGPPPQLSEVFVEQPECLLDSQEIDELDGMVGHLFASSDPEYVAAAWRAGLAYCRLLINQF